MSYAILRTKKLKSASQIARIGRHNERQQRTLNADPERRLLNVNYRPELTGSLVERVRGCIGHRQHRKDAVLAVEVLMAYSPEAEETIDALSWGITSMNWLEKEFGRDQIVSAWLHQDESRKHIQACVVMLDPNDRLNCKHFLGSPGKLSALQTRYAASVAKYGLKRGEESSKRKHVPIKNLYRDSNLLQDEATKAASLIDALREPSRINVPKKGFLESHHDYETRINELTRELLLRLWQQLQDAIRVLLQAGENVGLLKSERSARIAATTRARSAEKQAAIAERRAAKAERMVANQIKTIGTLEKKLAARCRELSVIQVARDLLKVAPTTLGNTSVLATKRYRLVIAGDRFELTDSCNATASLTKGSNAIDLVIALMRCKYSRAIEHLASRYDPDAIRSTCVSRAEAKAETLCRSPQPFSPRETLEALERPEASRHLASPPSKPK